jgi:hypothetical protein
LKHFKLKYPTVLTTIAMNTSEIDAQIKALQAQKKEQNKSEVRSNLARVVGNKSSTNEMILSACYTFIGTHRLNTGAPRKPRTAVTASE